jgi:predicted membrane protein
MSDANNNGTNNSRLFAGLFVIAIGVLFFLKQSGFAIFPYWLFTWPMILIIIGLFIGVKHGFRGAGWIVMLIIGSFFLLDDVLDMYSLRRYLVPAILVGVGIMIIARPKKNDGFSGFGNCNSKKKFGDTPPVTDSDLQPAADTNTGTGSTDDAEKLNASAIFGAVQKNIVSKNFQGGEVVSVFGGSEINLSKADINGVVTVEVTAIFGGVKLIIPSHWTVRQEVAAIFGGVEDNRDTHSIITIQNKVLVLKGTAFMGGIEISSYK